MNLEEQFLVEKKYHDGTTYIRIYSLEDILRDLSDSGTKKRYFKMPDLSTLQEIKINIGIDPAKE